MALFISLLTFLVTTPYGIRMFFIPGLIFFAFIEFANDRVRPVWRNRNDKKQRPYIVKNVITISGFTDCAGVCLCVRYVSWFL